jgi:hypothetical protein
MVYLTRTTAMNTQNNHTETNLHTVFDLLDKSIWRTVPIESILGLNESGFSFFTELIARLSHILPDLRVFSLESVHALLRLMPPVVVDLGNDNFEVVWGSQVLKLAASSPKTNQVLVRVISSMSEPEAKFLALLDVVALPFLFALSTSSTGVGLLCSIFSIKEKRIPKPLLASLFPDLTSIRQLQAAVSSVPKIPDDIQDQPSAATVTNNNLINTKKHESRKPKRPAGIKPKSGIQQDFEFGDPQAERDVANKPFDISHG